MSKIDIKKLKSRLKLNDHKAVMKALGIPAVNESVDKITYLTGDKHVNSYDGSAKLIYYKSNQIYVGYTSARSYDLIALTQTRLALLKQPASFLDAIHFIMRVAGIEAGDIKRISRPEVYNWEDELGPYLRFRHTGSSLKSYDPSILIGLQSPPILTWLDEGISAETQAKYAIGYYERTNSTTIPVFGKQGDLLGIRCREWNPERIEQLGKYHPLQTLDDTIYKFPTNAVLYGLNYTWPEIERTGEVWMCESEKAVLKLDTWYGEKSCAVATLGFGLGLQRRNQLIKHGVNRVVLVADCDFIDNPKLSYEEWESKIVREANIWKGYANVDIIWDDGKYLGPKENATDRNFSDWQKLYKAKESIV